MNNEYSFNRTKKIHISVASADKRINKFHDLCLDYVLQREPNQWSLIKKSNLVGDMLQQLIVPDLMFAQKEINNGVLTIVTDGLQRLTTSIEYAHNEFKISTKVERPIIKFVKRIEKDAKGETQFVWDSFDIRGKYFKDLPEILQSYFLDYEFEACVDLNCTDEQIQYNMRRLNDGCAMNNNQKAILKVGYEYMKYIKRFCGSEFFNDGKYKASEEKKNTYERICMDSMMAAYFAEDWKKNPQDNAEYIASNAIPGDFDSFGELLERVQNVVTDTNKVLFTPKDTHIWLAVFNRFMDLGEPDEKFGEFMDEFVRTLHAKSVNGISFDDLSGARRTRDKAVVCAKITMLYDLLVEFVGYDGADAISDIRKIADGFTLNKNDETAVVEQKKENTNVEDSGNNGSGISGSGNCDGDSVPDCARNSDDSRNEELNVNDEDDVNNSLPDNNDSFDDSGDDVAVEKADVVTENKPEVHRPFDLDKIKGEMANTPGKNKYVDPFADDEEDLKFSSPDDSSLVLDDDIDSWFGKPDQSVDREEDDYDNDDYDDLPW